MISEKYSYKQIITLVIAVSLIILITTSCSFFNYSGNFIKAVADGDYEKANDIYQSRIEGNVSDEEAADEAIRKMLDESIIAFAQDEIDYNTLQMRINSAKRVELLDIDYIAIENKANLLNDSKTAYAQAQEYINQELYAEALLELANVVEDDVNYNNAENLLVETSQSFRRKITGEADKHENEGNYLAAYAAVKNALEILPDDQELLIKQNAITENYINDLIGKSNETADAEGYLKASESLDNGILNFQYENIAANSNITELFEYYANEYLKELLLEADAVAQNKDYMQAVKYVNDGIAKYVYSNLKSNSSVTAKLQQYENEYVANAIATAQNFADEKDLVQAIYTINQALLKLSDNQLLNDKLSELRDLLPVSLSTLYQLPDQGSRAHLIWHFDIMLIDSYDNTYSEAILIRDDGYWLFSSTNTRDESYLIFEANKKYSKISGTLFALEGDSFTPDKDTVCTIYIYADDLLVWEESVTILSRPIEFTVDIYNCQNLKIAFNGNTAALSLGLDNVQVIP